ncbi:MAG: 2OG-Fe(II) oxygenase [Isosphaeraceae bacterium]
MDDDGPMRPGVAMFIDRRDGDRIYTVDQFLDEATCHSLIEQGESLGFGVALIGQGEDAAIRLEFRDNNRAMTDDPGLADGLFVRARPLLPASWSAMGRVWVLDGLNPRIRFYRYDPGQRFAPHYDGHYRAPDGSTSFLTFLVYLRGGIGGGSTRFYRRGDSGHFRVAFEVCPAAGMALVFAHDELHEGAPVESGRKYVVRSDVMYRLATSRG